jgi:hypothetical protein
VCHVKDYFRFTAVSFNSIDKDIGILVNCGVDHKDRNCMSQNVNTCFDRHHNSLRRSSTVCSMLVKINIFHLNDYQQHAKTLIIFGQVLLHNQHI